MKKDYGPRSRRNIKLQSDMSKKAAKIIAENYSTLKTSICNEHDLNIAGATEEDIFNDTVIFVIHEKDISKLSEVELLDHFKDRFKMLMFQITQDENSKQKHLSENIRDYMKIYGR